MKTPHPDLLDSTIVIGTYLLRNSEPVPVLFEAFLKSVYANTGDHPFGWRIVGSSGGSNCGRARLSQLDSIWPIDLMSGAGQNVYITSYPHQAPHSFENVLWEIHSEWIPCDNAEVGCVVLMYLNSALVRRHGAKAFATVVSDVFARADRSSAWIHGFIDADLSERIGYGTHYSSTELGNRLFRYEVEKREWNAMGPEKFRRVRGPFWGTFLGADLAKKVDSRGDIAMELGAYQSRIGLTSASCTRFPGGGILLCASSDPMDCIDRDPSSWDRVVDATVWLRRRLRDSGVAI